MKSKGMLIYYGTAVDFIFDTFITFNQFQLLALSLYSFLTIKKKFNPG